MNNLIKLAISCLLLVSGMTLNAQEKQTIKPLKVGDLVPNLRIYKIIRYDRSAAAMADFKDKLLILDFWDTSCGSCILAMPRLDSLRNKFKGQLEILPVTFEPESKVSNFFNRNKYVKDLQLPCVVEDQQLSKYFPHQTVSHLVWIYKGEIKAITHAEYATERNIKMVLNGEPINWPVKTDVAAFDYNKPFAAHQIGKPFLKGNLDGVERSAGVVYDSLQRYTRVYHVNFGIIDLYRNIWSKIERRKYIPHPGRLVLEVKDSTKYVFDPKKGFSDAWVKKNTYCFERIFRKNTLNKEDFQQVIRELDGLFKVKCRYEYRMARCLVISAIIGTTPDSTALKQNGKHKTLIDDQVFFLDYTYKYPPVVDESKYTGPIYIDKWSDLESLKKELNKNGFDIREGERMIEQMILTEVK